MSKIPTIREQNRKKLVCAIESAMEAASSTELPRPTPDDLAARGQNIFYKHPSGNERRPKPDYSKYRYRGEEKKSKKVPCCGGNCLSCPKKKAK